jgi:hypothetical protein
MKLSQFTQHLAQLSSINFIQPNGDSVPAHFHITEAGLTTKHFIDCGGTVRTEKNISFQLWVANDLEHRLTTQKLLKIIEVATPLFENEDLEVEIEYQQDSISRYGLDFKDNTFVLVPKQTNCLAQDSCGIPTEKPRIKLTELKSSCCKPGDNCC